MEICYVVESGSICFGITFLFNMTSDPKKRNNNNSLEPLPGGIIESKVRFIQFSIIP